VYARVWESESRQALSGLFRVMQTSRSKMPFSDTALPGSEISGHRAVQRAGLFCCDQSSPVDRLIHREFQLTQEKIVIRTLGLFLAQPYR